MLHMSHLDIVSYHDEVQHSTMNIPKGNRLNCGETSICRAYFSENAKIKTLIVRESNIYLTSPVPMNY